MGNTPCPGSMTPWGRADFANVVAEGIVSLSTPGHGGYWVSPARLETIRAHFPELLDTFAGFPWFEEDCDWAYVALSFAEHFDEAALVAAQKTVEYNRARSIQKMYVDPKTGRSIKAVSR